MGHSITSSAGGVIIDRRGESGGKHVSNEQRFRDRHQKAIKDRMDELLRDRSIKDAVGEGGGTIRGTTTEPTFQIDRKSGETNHVVPGNKEFHAGDSLPKPKGGGAGKGGAGNSGEGEDDFVFNLSRSDMIKYLFDELELPDLERRNMSEADEVRLFRAGFSKSGNPSLIHVQRTFKEGLARRIAAKGGKNLKIEDLEEQLRVLREKRHYGPGQGSHDPEVAELEAALEAARALKIPYYLENDLRFRAQQEEPMPMSKAVMFCIMDVSGSMDEDKKFIAKKFFMLLYLFLTTRYKKIDVVFLRHTSEAQEVDEQTFFYDKQTGGTVVSSVLRLMRTVIEARYSSGDWNIYAAQGSDGDNWNDDSKECVQILEDDLLPVLQYFAYIEIAKDKQDLWEHYEALMRSLKSKKFAIQRVRHQKDVYPVFRKLFRKREEK